MKDSVAWLLFTFFSTLFCYYLLDWTLTLTCFISGFLMALKAMISEQTDENQ